MQFLWAMHATPRFRYYLIIKIVNCSDHVINYPKTSKVNMACHLLGQRPFPKHTRPYSQQACATSTRPLPGNGILVSSNTDLHNNAALQSSSPVTIALL